MTALYKILKEEIKWPCEEELQAEITNLFQNDPFLDVMCAVDGLEIRISLPSDPSIQLKTWSVKNHQNSLNIMLITKLDGEIIYFSPLHVGAHDQSHWNELGHHNLFLWKSYGVT